MEIQSDATGMLQGLFVSGCSLKSNLHYQDSLTMIFFHIECMSSTGETHTHLCAHPEETVFVKLCDQQSVHAFNWKKKNKRASLTTPFQARPSDLCLWGLNL